MARPGVNYHDVMKAAETIRGRQQEPTVDRVLAVLGTGSRSTIGPLLKRWKAEHSVAIEAIGLPSDLVETVKSLYERVNQLADHKVAQAQAELHAMAAQLKQERATLDARLAHLESRNRELENRCQSLEKEAHSLRQALEQARIDTVRYDTELSASQARLAEAQSVVKELRQENRDIRSHFEHYQTHIAADRQHEREQHGAVQTQLERHQVFLMSQLNDATERVNGLTQELSSLTSLQQETEAAAENTRAELTVKQRDIELLQNSLSQKEVEFGAVKTKNSELEKHCQALQTAVASEQRQLKTREQMLAELRDALEVANGKILNLDDEKRIAMEESEVLRTQLKQLQRTL